MSNKYIAKRHILENSPADDVIDLRDFVRAFWVKRWFVLACFVLGGLLGAVFNGQVERFEVHGFMYVDMPLENYKWLDVGLKDPAVLVDFLSAVSVGGVSQNDLFVELTKPGALKRALRAEFSVSGPERRDLGVKVGAQSELVGYQLLLESSAPINASSIATIGGFVQDTAIRTVLKNELQRKCFEHVELQRAAGVEELNGKFFVEKLESRIESLQKLAIKSRSDDERRQDVFILQFSHRATNPEVEEEEKEADKLEALRVERELQRLLPLSTQINAARIAVEDQRLAAHERQRQMVADAIQSEFYCGAVKYLDESDLAKTFFAVSAEMLDSAIASHLESSTPEEVVDVVRAAVELQISQWQHRFIERIHLSVSPDAAVLVAPSKSFVRPALLGAFLGLFVGCLLALAGGWWSLNKDFVKGH